MIKEVRVEPLIGEVFAPYGDVLEPGNKSPDQDYAIYKYWDKIAKLSFSNDPTELGYLRVFRRPFNFDKMERHNKASQSFIPVTRSSSFIAVAKGKQDEQQTLPDLNTLKAFILDGTKGINLYPGTWHWSIFPIDESADYIMVVRRDTIVDDQEIVSLGTTIELKL